MKANLVFLTLALTGAMVLLALQAKADGAVSLNNYDSGYDLWLVQNGATNPAPAGDMVMGFSGSTATNYISAFYVNRMADGSMPTPPFVIQTGSGYYNQGSQWEDYSFTTVDPIDDLTFWTVQSYATTARKRWADWILPVRP